MSINLNSSILTNSTDSGTGTSAGGRSSTPGTFSNSSILPFNGTNPTNNSISGGDSAAAGGNGAFNPLLFIIPVSVGLAFLVCFCFSRYLPYITFRLRKNPIITQEDDVVLVKLDKADEDSASQTNTDITRKDNGEDDNDITDDTSSDVDCVSDEKNTKGSADLELTVSNPYSSGSVGNRRDDYVVVIDGGKGSRAASANPISRTTSFAKRMSSRSLSLLQISSKSSQTSLISGHSSASAPLKHISQSHVSNGIVDIVRVESPPCYTSPTAIDAPSSSLI